MAKPPPVGRRGVGDAAADQDPAPRRQGSTWVAKLSAGPPKPVLADPVWPKERSKVPFGFIRPRRKVERRTPPCGTGREPCPAKRRRSRLSTATAAKELLGG